jgi:hypothetical protein
LVLSLSQPKGMVASGRAVLMFLYSVGPNLGNMRRNNSGETHSQGRNDQELCLTCDKIKSYVDCRSQFVAVLVYLHLYTCTCIFVEG